MPKQLLPLTGRGSLLQETFARTRCLPPPLGEPVVVCNEAHRFLVMRQLQDRGASPRLILEPQGRNTAPAVAVAALALSRGNSGNSLLLVMPSDHVIADGESFARAVSMAIPAAVAGRLVTFGIAPTRAETGYGYIRAGGRGAGPQDVVRFVEKPDADTAERYVQSGDYYWNSGMFLFSADAYLREIAQHAPEMLQVCEAALTGGRQSQGFLQLASEPFLKSPSDSIDYAVMEKTTLASVVPLDAGWSDVGSWAALHEIADCDSAGNGISGDVVAVDCRNSYLRAESRLLGVVGLDGCVVIETSDAVLVAPLARAQDVKALVDELQHRRRPEVVVGREVFRPWGSYDSIESAADYQVKRLAVLPGAVLSLQLHHRRAEHWVVVRGTARITRDDEVFDLQRNQHTFIPLGARHRIENPGRELLEIIEVQIGDYLGEDDIVRFEDRYGREGRTD
jgi:mannose-1-phosphate guanylyltransferase/mannose-6-phosphate isomerase